MVTVGVVMSLEDPQAEEEKKDSEAKQRERQICWRNVQYLCRVEKRGGCELIKRVSGIQTEGGSNMLYGGE